MNNSSKHITIRWNKKNPNHHLWNNNGTWWCHFVLTDASGGADRRRISLKTRDLDAARTRRDGLLASLAEFSGRIRC